jgi:hypothetical protein
VTLEKMGIPVAAIGVERLIKLTGRAMMRAHGFRDYPWVVVPDSNSLGHTDEQVREDVDAALPQIELVLSPRLAEQPRT